jgi:ATP-dependent Clp protease adapter protein ClpS
MFPMSQRAAPEKTAAPAAPTLDPATTPRRGVEQDFDRDVLLQRLPPYKVVVHDNAYNTFGEVTKILMKAVPGITYRRALAYTYEIHSTGAAVPYTGPQEQAEAVAAVIRTIGIKVTVERDE